MKNDDLIFGRHPVIEALEMGKNIDKVFFQTGVRGELEKEVRKLCKEAKVPLQYVPVQKLNRLVKGNHQGIIALMPIIEYQRLEEIVPFLFEQGKNPLLVLLDGITDIRNIGAIARSAEIFGANALVIPQKGGGWINGVALKTSAGALNRIPVCRVNKMDEAIDMVHNHGIQIFASDLKAEKKIDEMDWKEPCGIVLGAEGEGISVSVRAQVDDTFIIPQVGQTDSLNVSVAAGIMFFSAMNKRMK